MIRILFIGISISAFAFVKPGIFGNKSSVTIISYGETDTLAVYAFKNNPQTRLILRTDSTFEFIGMQKDPYLFVNDHIDERFFITTGRWQKHSNKLFLTSYTDSIVYNLSEIKVDTSRQKEVSVIRFYNIYNDSVGAGWYTLADGTTVIAGTRNRRLYRLEIDFPKDKCVITEFYGYGKWEYCPNFKGNYDITVKLRPAYKPGYFEKTKFLMKEDTLIQSKKKLKNVFIKVTPGRSG